MAFPVTYLFGDILIQNAAKDKVFSNRMHTLREPSGGKQQWVLQEERWIFSQRLKTEKSSKVWRQGALAGSAVPGKVMNAGENISLYAPKLVRSVLMWCKCGGGGNPLSVGGVGHRGEKFQHNELFKTTAYCIYCSTNFKQSKLLTL